MQYLPTKTAVFVKIVTFKEDEVVSLKSDSEVGFNDFPNIEELSLRQNSIEREAWEQITDS